MKHSCYQSLWHSRENYILRIAIASPVANELVQVEILAVKFEPSVILFVFHQSVFTVPHHWNQYRIWRLMISRKMWKLRTRFAYGILRWIFEYLKAEETLNNAVVAEPVTPQSKTIINTINIAASSTYWSGSQYFYTFFTQEYNSANWVNAYRNAILGNVDHTPTCKEAAQVFQDSNTDDLLRVLTDQAWPMCHLYIVHPPLPVLSVNKGWKWWISNHMPSQVWDAIR